VAFLAAVGLQLFSRGGVAAERYVTRGVSVFADSFERLEHMTILQFEWVLRHNGFFGSGAGTGAQGSQYFGGGAHLVGGAAEGGLGKVLAELGVPGFLALCWLGVVLARILVDRARRARELPLEEAVPRYALLAFLPANAAVFFTAHQVFGDPFILILLGWMSGAVLALPREQLAAALAPRAPQASRGGRRLPLPAGAR
jgi:hypothetical protein